MLQSFKNWIVVESHINDLRALGLKEEFIRDCKKIAKVYPKDLRGVFYCALENYIERGLPKSEALTKSMQDVQEIITKNKNEIVSNNAH